MTDQSKLENRHKSLSEKVETLESQRQYKRNFEHKSDLINLKKALYLINNSEEDEGKKLLNKIIDSDSKFKNIAEEINKQ